MRIDYPCVHYDGGKCRKFSDQTVTSYCVMGPCPSQAQSNADRIRAMSDEELAEFLYRYFWGRLPKLYIGQKGLFDWLQQPAEDGAE